MKILQINSVCGTGSTGRIACDLAAVLRGEGDECRIAFGRGSAPAGEDAFRIGNDADFARHLLRTRLTDGEGQGSVSATRELLRQIEAWDPGLIQLHNLHGYYLNQPMLFDFLAHWDKPVVWTLHDLWAVTGHCAHFTRVGCERWRKGCHDCPRKKEYPASLFADRSAEKWRQKKECYAALKNLTLVTPSRWVAGFLPDSILHDIPVNIIPSGVDLRHFAPTESDLRKRYGLENKKIVLAAATTWYASKGLYSLQCLPRELGEDFCVVLVGLTAAQQKDLPAGVLGLPRTDSVRELAAWYTAADVVVNAGREETQGMTTLEAMACGTPVAVSPYSAVPELVTPQGGVVLEGLEPSQIAAGVREALTGDRDPRANAMPYEKNHQFLQYRKLYQSLLSK